MKVKIIYPILTLLILLEYPPPIPTKMIRHADGQRIKKNKPNAIIPLYPLFPAMI